MVRAFKIIGVLVSLLLNEVINTLQIITNLVKKESVSPIVKTRNSGKHMTN